MLGLIKKDILLIKANFKSMIIIFIVYLILAFQGMFDVTFVIPLIGIILFISTFSYDDFNNWNSYAITFPDGRKNVVKAKYIASIILVLILGLLCILLSLSISSIRGNDINIHEIITSMMEAELSSVIIISLLYPVMFKFGSTNGRIILFSVIFAITGIGTLITRFVDTNYIINLINGLDNYLFISVFIISIISLIISYLISNKIYKNKEF